MKNSTKWILGVSALCVAAASLAVCLLAPKGALIKGSVAGAPESEIVVAKLDINRFETLDTLTTDADGAFRYRLDIRKGQPEFVYFFRNDRKIASLLLERGDRVTLNTDTLGVATVFGSPESEKLAQVEQSLANFSAEFAALAGRLNALKEGSREYAAVSREMAAKYVGYYKDRLKYVLSNSHSLTVVPVMFQQVGENLPLFSQHTDALHFRSISDSLETVYPESAYVKSLRAAADERMRVFELSSKIQTATEVSYLDIEMPDVTGVKRKLSELDDKVVLLHFWSASRPAQKMFNLDVLKPLYERYRGRGFEIYQVAVDVDKADWARTIRDQQLEWVNVCDGLGTASPVVAAYNLSSLPVSFLFSKGQMVQTSLRDEASLRRALDKLL